ncbi:MAG TPA: hypothetical protein VMZ49_12585 [Patescibacteria group bacterium]|nr:hypothetical protein [Patescibacteria group bacterium]
MKIIFILIGRQVGGGGSVRGVLRRQAAAALFSGQADAGIVISVFFRRDLFGRI